MASQEFYAILEVILDPERIDPEVLRKGGGEQAGEEGPRLSRTNPRPEV
jgi:hypothetical protein